MAVVRGLVILAVAAGLCIGIQQAEAAPAHQVNRLSYGQIVTGRLDEMNLEENWVFAGHAGDVLLADMQAVSSEGLDPFLTLSDYTQTSLTTDDDSGEYLNARIGPFVLPYSGEYTLTASSYSYGGAGTYALQITNLNTAPTLKLDKPLVGVLTSSHPRDYFRLVVPPDFTANTLLRLSAQDDQLYNDPFVSLYDTNGLVNTSEGHSEAVIDPLLLVPGQVYAVVVSWNWDGGGGPYELRLAASAITLLADDTPQTGTLDYEMSSQRHYFSGLAGQQVRLTVGALDETLAPMLRVMLVSAQLYLFSNDGEYTREISALLTLPEDGLYQVEIGNGSLVGEPGSYTVSLELVEAAGAAP